MHNPGDHSGGREMSDPRIDHSPRCQSCKAVRLVLDEDLQAALPPRQQGVLDRVESNG
jgi:hypothetical protein